MYLQDYWVFALCSSFGILKNTVFRKLVASILRWGGGRRPLCWASEWANLIKQSINQSIIQWLRLALSSSRCLPKPHLRMETDPVLVTSFQQRQPGLDPRSGHVGFVVDKVVLGQGFSEYFGFPCQFSFHQLLHTHQHPSSGAGTTGQIVANVPSGLSLRPPPPKKKN
jgi:hypothetical protein